MNLKLFYHNVILNRFPRSVNNFMESHNACDIMRDDLEDWYGLLDMSETKPYLRMIEETDMDKEIINIYLIGMLVHIASAARLRKDIDKLFFLTKNLAMSLLHTDPYLDLTDIHLPFKSFYIEIDDEFVLDEMDYYKSSGCYVFDEGDKIGIVLVGKNIHESASEQICIASRWLIDKKKYNSAYDIIEPTYMGSYQDASMIERTQMSKVISFVINTIDYIDSDKSDIEYIQTTSKKKIRAAKKAGPGKALPTGFNVIGGKFAEMAPMSDFDSSDRFPAYKHEFRWLVKGHWKRQMIGPRSERRYKKVRIQPFIKGPDGAPIKPPKYRVQ